MLQVELRGHTRIANNLMRSAARISKRFDNVMAREAERGAEELSSEPYPPPKPPYQRTGLLGQSWDTHTLGRGRHAVINTAPYSGLVVGAGTQAWMHEGYWWTVDEVLSRRSNTRRILGALLSEVHEAINGTG